MFANDKYLQHNFIFSNLLLPTNRFSDSLTNSAHESEEIKRLNTDNRLLNIFGVLGRPTKALIMVKPRRYMFALIPLFCRAR